MLDNKKGALIYYKGSIKTGNEFFVNNGITNVRVHRFNSHISYTVVDHYFPDVELALEFLKRFGIEKSSLDSYQIIN